MSEKIGGAKGTELDDDFHEMEKVCICYNIHQTCSERSLLRVAYRSFEIVGSSIIHE